MQLRETYLKLDGAEPIDAIYQNSRWRIMRLVLNDPGLIHQLNDFVLSNQTALVGLNSGEGEVKSSELAQFRNLLRNIAAADAEYEDGALARSIRQTLLPRVSRRLIGMNYQKALSCFFDAHCATSGD